MLFSIYSIDHSLIPLFRGLPLHLPFQRITGAKSLYAIELFGAFVFYQLNTSKFLAFFSHAYIKQRVSLLMKIPPGLYMHFAMKNAVAIMDEFDHPAIYEGEIQFMNLSSHISLDFNTEGEFKALDILVPKVLLTKFLDEYSGNSSGYNLFSSGLGILQNFKIQEIIQEIVSCPHHGWTQRYYLASKIQILLIECWCLLVERANQHQINGYDDQFKLYRSVVQVLDKSIYSQHPPSVKELARMFTTNEKKIELAFKKIIDKTAIEYFKDKQMAMILKDVLESNKTLSNISFEYGYESYSGMARAFKRKFGKTPHEARASMKSSKL